MSIYIGDKEIKDLKIGTTTPSAVYLGTTQVRPNKPKTYTIVWYETSTPSSFFVEYKDDAANLTQGSTDFDKFFGYSAVLLDASGNEVEEVTQGQSGGDGMLDMSKFSGALTGTANNVMIKFPRRGIKISKDGQTVTLSITEEPNKDGYQYYAFTKGSSDKDYLYLGAYEGSFTTNNSSVSSYSSGSTWLKSWATQTKTTYSSPATNQSRANFRTTAAKYGNGYSLTTFYVWQYIAALYMMKYGNPDSQTVVGDGWTGYTSADNYPATPGGTNSQTNATYGASGGSTQTKLFGLEDRWGSVSEILDCCNVDSSRNLTVDKTNNIFQDGAYSTNLGNNFVHGSLVLINGTNDTMFLGLNASGGSSSTYYCDYMTLRYGPLTTGGNRRTRKNSGIFYLTRDNQGDGSKYTGARLMYL